MRKIKIVFMMQHLTCGGAEQALYDLICLMDKTKFDVSVFALVGGGVWESKFTEAGIPVVNVFDKRERGSSFGVFIKHQLMKLKTYWVIHQDSRKLLKMFFPKGVDIAVPYSMWGDEAAALGYNAKHVRFIHGNIGSNEELRDIIMNNLGYMMEYDRIICISEESHHAFKQITGIENSVRMCYNPIDAEKVASMALENVPFPQDVPVICAVGRLAREKGYDRLIRIHKRILDQGMEHKLVIVGDGPEKEHLCQVIQETETEDSVVLAGYQSNPYPYMKNSRFLVCSSYTEGLPVIAMEAVSLGIPVVSAVPSILEVFGDLACGIITENDDHSLECGIVKMLCDNVFYEKTKQETLIRSTFFDGKRMVKELEDMFVEVMEEDEHGSH